VIGPQDWMLRMACPPSPPLVKAEKIKTSPFPCVSYGPRFLSLGLPSVFWFLGGLLWQFFFQDDDLFFCKPPTSWIRLPFSSRAMLVNLFASSGPQSCALP